MKTRIEWATHTENYQAGCTKVSPACTHCYAIEMSARLERMGGPTRYEGVAVAEAGHEPRWTGRIKVDLDAMQRIFQGLVHAKKPRRVFLNSMTDTFHEDVSEDVLAELAMCLSWDLSKHVVMLLTKRPERMAAWAARHFPSGLPSHVWVGCTVEDQRRADERIPQLLRVPAAVRFLSMEPLLGAVDLSEWLERIDHCNDCGAENPPQGPDKCPECGHEGTLISTWGNGQAERYKSGQRYENNGPGPNEDGPQISWVIAGGESGRKARPSHPDWFSSLRQQCVAAGVPFHFKQWGEWCPRGPESSSPNYAAVDGVPRVRLSICGCNSRSDIDEHGVPGAFTRHECDLSRDSFVQRIGKHAAGRLLDGRTWDELPGEPAFTVTSISERPEVPDVG